MRLVHKLKQRAPASAPYLVNREPLSEITCTRIAADCGMTPLQVAVTLGIGSTLRGKEGRLYQLREETAP